MAKDASGCVQMKSRIDLWKELMGTPAFFVIYSAELSFLWFVKMSRRLRDASTWDIELWGKCLLRESFQQKEEYIVSSKHFI